MNLYVHFPFCRAKCAYCALLSRAAGDAEIRRAYVARLLDELPAEPFETVYLGGGTPALCDLAPLLEALATRGPTAEFTVELHPRDVGSGLLDLLRRGGVNRISLGIQSLDDAALSAMGRGYAAAEAEAAFRAVQEVFPNSGFDLIAGWPGTSEASWRRTLSRVPSLRPAHVSCYALIREPGTRVDRAVRSGRLVLPDDEIVGAQIDAACAALAAAGLVRYEVSNFARPGLACRHNLAVWRGEDYFGLGEGAHGRLGTTRTVGTATGYETTQVGAAEDAFERAVLGLRTADGLDLDAVARRWPLLAPRLPGWRDRLEALVAPGVLGRVGASRYVPTSRGFDVCDAVMAELV